MFDFTKNISLDPAWQKKYLLARGFLYSLFLAGALYFADAVLFPSQFFSVDLNNKDTKSNTIYNVNVSENKINFDAFSSENFSSAEVRIYFKDNLTGKNFGEVKARKTYKAFGYPEAKELPALSQETNRFPNGSLVSFDNAVFIIDNKQAFPFKDPQTFVSMGYDWNDVVPIQENELESVRSKNLFTIDRPHPDGTVFSTRENGKYFLINGEQKHELGDPALLKKYLKSNPILADEKSLSFQNSCNLEDVFLELENSYQCSVSTSSLTEFLGNNYQFEANGIPAGTLEKIEVEFSRNINWLNLREALSKIKRGVLANLGYENK